MGLLSYWQAIIHGGLNSMNEKKIYIWKLATFLHSQDMVMSGEELAEHLNRNKLWN